MSDPAADLPAAPSDEAAAHEPTAEERFLGRALILASALLWSSSGFFAKATWFQAWPLASPGWMGWELPVRGPVLAFWRALFVSLVLLPFLRRPRWHPWLAPLALIFTAMNVTYLCSMSYTTAANAIWLQNTAPAWVFVIGVWLLGERVTGRDWALLGLSMVGVGVILGGEFLSLGAVGSSPAGVAYGLFSGLCYACVLTSLRALRNEDSAWLIFLNHLTTVLVLTPYVVERSSTLGLWPSGWQWLALAAFGALQMGAPYVLFARGLQSIPSHEATTIGLIEPLLVPLWVYLAWGADPSYEAPRWWTWVGGGLILVGLLARLAWTGESSERK